MLFSIFDLLTFLKALQMFFLKFLLTLLWWRLLSYRNQSITLLRKSMDWFLYDNAVCRERVKMGKKIKKNVEFNIFFEVQKYYFVFESRLISFFKWSYSQRWFDVVQRCENRRWKWQRWTLLSSTLKNTTLFQRCSTL